MKKRKVSKIPTTPMFQVPSAGSTADPTFTSAEAKEVTLALCKNDCNQLRDALGVEVMVRCDGNPNYHKCDDRECPHRKPHAPTPGRCGVKGHNLADCWCNAPGTVSLTE
jgi:hypothetical protein